MLWETWPGKKDTARCCSPTHSRYILRVRITLRMWGRRKGNWYVVRSLDVDTYKDGFKKAKLFSRIGMTENLNSGHYIHRLISTGEILSRSKPAYHQLHIYGVMMSSIHGHRVGWLQAKVNVRKTRKVKRRREEKWYHRPITSPNLSHIPSVQLSGC